MLPTDENPPTPQQIAVLDLIKKAWKILVDCGTSVERGNPDLSDSFLNIRRAVKVAFASIELQVAANQGAIVGANLNNVANQLIDDAKNNNNALFDFERAALEAAADALLTGLTESEPVITS